MREELKPTRDAAGTAHLGPCIDRVGGFDVIACGRCGFRHVLPLPTADELAHAYRHDYYAVEKPLYLERTRQDQSWWRIVHRDRLAAIEAELPPGRRRLLEIGSGPGFFLAEARERGWTPLGVEPSRQAAEHTRGLGIDVVEAFFDADTAGRLGRFDAVQMTNVLEHVPDPRAILQLAHERLAPGGVVSVIVPNDYNPFQRAVRDACDHAPWWVAPPHHLNYFDFDSLAALLADTGFVPVARSSSFPIDLFLLMGERYVGDDAVGRRCHEMRMRFEENLEAAGQGELRRALYRSLAQLGLGREVWIVARRP
jgi:SAM-dependent methyltransferase